MSSRLPDLLFPRLPLLAAALAAAVTGAVLQVLLVPLLVGSLFDDVLVDGDFTQLGRVLLTGGVVALLGALALWAQDSWFGRLAAGVAARWRESTYLTLLRRDSLSGQESSGGLASRILADLREVETFLQFGLGTLVVESVTVVTIFVLLLRMNATATGVLLLLTVPLALLLILVGRKVEQAATRTLELTEQTGAHLQEGLGQLEVVRAFGLAGFLRSRLQRDNLALARAQSRRAVWAGLQTPLAQLLGFVALAVLVTLLAAAVAQGRMTLGQVTSFITLVALLTTPVQLLPRALAMRQSAQAAERRLQTLAAEAAPASEAREPRSATAGAALLALEQLSFSFAGGGPLLDRVSVELPERGLVVLTGASGAGKSTLLRLLLGLLSPDSGRVLLRGVDLQSLRDADLRRAVAYVPQETALFRASLRDNLLLGREFTDRQLRDVLQQVELDELLTGSTPGLDYELAERGAGLSGGQKQRLAIARALLGEPLVLLLDEPTSNLDHASEAAVLRTLKRQACQRLLLTTTHRPVLLQHAALILELSGSGQLEQRSASPVSRANPGEKGEFHDN